MILGPSHKLLKWYETYELDSITKRKVCTFVRKTTAERLLIVFTLLSTVKAHLFIAWSLEPEHTQRITLLAKEYCVSEREQVKDCSAY